MATINEQIEALERTRAAKANEMAAIVEKAAGESRSMDSAEAEAFDTAKAAVDALDKDIERLKALEAIQAKTAKPAIVEADEKAKQPAQTTTAAAPRIELGKSLPKGTAFTRYAMALARARGSLADAIRYAKQWESSTPEVIRFLEKASAGTTTDASWAGPLVEETNLVGEFIELLRPETILGKLNGLRNVPFNVSIPRTTGGSTVGWVGETGVKPVGEMAFDTVTLGHNKVAGIVVLTDELVRFSSPNAEDVVRRDLIEQMSQFLDDAFINPANSGTPGTSPASVTNGAASIPASGTDAEAFMCDLASLQELFISSNLSLSGTYLVMSAVQASRLALFRNALGQYEFPNITANGGTIAGIPVVTSENMPRDTSGHSYIALVKPSEILLADDSNVTLDASREATLDMNGGGTPNFSLFQRNCVAIRAERYITWAKRRAQAVAYIHSADYTPCSP